MLRVSVIVVSYNSMPFLGTCLQSILAELGPEDELIVVDNASTDDSVQFVRTHYPQARLVQNKNAGYAGGNNLGTQLAGGEYLVFFNPDTYLHPGSLSKLLAPLQESTNVAMTTACVLMMQQPEVINTCGNTVHFTGLTYCRGAGEGKSNYSISSDVDAISGVAFAVHRSVFEKLGGFDERFFMYVEDTDLSWRARLAGFRCLYVADAFVQHYYSMSYSPGKAFYLDRNRHFMLLKNLSRSTYRKMLPALLLSEVVTGVFLLLQGPRYWGVKPRVYRWLWQNRKLIEQAYQETQAFRRVDDRQVVGELTHLLEFEQLAGRNLARLAGLVLHPIFGAARSFLFEDHL